MMEANQCSLAPVKKWLAMPLEANAHDAIERVRRADDVVHIAVMPDVHLAGDVCVGTAMATRRLLYPSAVGGDIGAAVRMTQRAFNGLHPRGAVRLLFPGHNGAPSCEEELLLWF